MLSKLQLLGNTLKTWEQFKAAIRQKESSGNYKAINKKSNCIGAYQFCESTFYQIQKDLKIKVSTSEFLNNPELQDTFFEALIKRKFSIELGEGNISTMLRTAKVKFGSNITVSGLYGAMHLGGAQGLIKLLIKNKDRKDINNTTVSSYLKLFSGYTIPYYSMKFDTDISNFQETTNKQTGKVESNFTPFIFIGVGLVISILLLK